LFPAIREIEPRDKNREAREGDQAMDGNHQDSQPLTSREQRVLKLVADGQTNKEIAAALRISPATVKRHLENIFRKLKLKNRVRAAVFAVSEKSTAR
jgi:DNA-binding NarL/FixJ family response regulator